MVGTNFVFVYRTVNSVQNSNDETKQAAMGVNPVSRAAIAPVVACVFATGPEFEFFKMLCFSFAIDSPFEIHPLNFFLSA
jgi:hypothetical protein